MLLLTVIYIAFISLGLPDSMFGTAWPAIYGEWRLPFSFGSFVVSIIYCGTAVSSLMSTHVIKQFGTGRVTAFSTALTAVAMAGFAVSGNFACICLCAVPLGLGAGAIDTALNNYVASNYSARHVNYLHCFYGIGIVASPYILSHVIGGDGGWRNGYFAVSLIQAVIAIILIGTLFLWKNDNNTDHDTETEVIPMRTLFKMPKVRLICYLFVTSCAIEASIGGFGGTFLVEQKGMPTNVAASTIIFYYAGIAIARFVAGLLSNKIGTWKIIVGGQILLGVGLLTLLFSANNLILSASLFLIGAGNGPMFPNFIFITPEVFGHAKSAAVIGAEMSVASLTSMSVPIICGFSAQYFGISIFPYFIMAFFVAMAFLSYRATSMLFQENNTQH